MIDSVFLSWSVWFKRFEDVEGFGGKENGTVSVGFEIDTDVVSFSGVMEVFDAGWNAFDGKAL